MFGADFKDHLEALNLRQRAAYDLLAEAISLQGKDQKGRTITTVRLAVWRTMLVERNWLAAGQSGQVADDSAKKLETLERNLRRVKKHLENEGLITIEGDYVQLS